MTTGLWVHKTPACGGPLAAIGKAKRIGASHLIVKARDGMSVYRPNKPTLDSLALSSRISGVDIWLWAWVRSMSPGKGRSYVEDQAMLLAQDARLTKAKVVVANMESPWSWSKIGGGFLLGEDELRQRAYIYISTLRDCLPDDCKIAVSSFRFPKWHRLPWEEMLPGVIGMPQIYFERKGYDEQAREARIGWSAFGVTSVRISGPAYTWKAGKMNPAAFHIESKRHCDGIDWWKADGLGPDELQVLEGL